MKKLVEITLSQTIQYEVDAENSIRESQLLDNELQRMKSDMFCTVALPYDYEITKLIISGKIVR